MAPLGTPLPVPVARGAGSPQTCRAQISESLVGRHESETLACCLCHEQPIERIAMRGSHQSGHPNVRNLDREKAKALSCHLVLEVVDQPPGLRPFAEADLDGDLPGCGNADVDSVGAVRQNLPRPCAEPLVLGQPPEQDVGVE